MQVFPSIGAALANISGKIADDPLLTQRPGGQAAKIAFGMKCLDQTAPVAVLVVRLSHQATISAAAARGLC